MSAPYTPRAGVDAVTRNGLPATNIEIRADGGAWPFGGIVGGVWYSWTAAGHIYGPANASGFDLVRDAEPSPGPVVEETVSRERMREKILSDPDLETEAGRSHPEAPVVEETATPPAPDGMTLRDWFAGQALAGILANPEGMASVLPAFNPVVGETPFATAHRNDLGKTAYEIADAMLAARQIGEAM